ncbi:conserved oligomeric Golgi complex subunit 8 [Entomortierella parvispora]|uniref:Conserved oligomeric Golgi complex subunit 8 n=1 Tax=Entomortierella parvispora TaxID=205924 RepID=A0A9P3M056_9FUNG|nr:conserved oligomeric Golgi complex subunit 8 [Entomortierella parvispora]
MALDTASTQGFEHYPPRDQRESPDAQHGSHGHTNSHPGIISNNSHGSSSTDQDALFDLILQQVPTQKREMLSTSWSKDYLNRLTALPARALQNEPEKLREEQLKVERDMSELAFRDYKAFILVKDCKQEVQSTFEQMGQHLDRFQETIPTFVETLTGVSARVAPILERQHVFSSILATHSQLLEVLEIPLLMETCVRNGYYNEALELASHVQRLVLRYPGIGIIQEIEIKVAQGKEMMLVQLLAQLREPIKLPVALRIIGFLRRIGSFNGTLSTAAAALDDEDGHPTTTSTSASGHAQRGSSVVTEDETPLKMLFLKSRGLYMHLQLSKIVLHKGDSFGFLKKYIDVTRECLFDIMAYYRSIFGSVDSYSGLGSSTYTASSSLSSTEALPSSASATSSQKQHCWTTDNLLADFVTYRTQTLLQMLHTHIPQIHDTSALSSVLTQLMYLGANMAKIGFDLRYLVTSLFEEAVVRVVGGQFERGAEDFLESLGGEGKNFPDWSLPSHWMLGSTGRAPTSSSSSPTLTRTGTGANGEAGASSTSMSPQTCLMDYPPLAYLTNAYLSALNSLRLLAPLAVAMPLRQILIESLTRVDMALEEYDRFIFGDRRGTPSAALAFRSRLLKNHKKDQALNGHSHPGLSNGHHTQDAESNSSASSVAPFRLQGMEGSVVLSEQQIMDGFLVVYKRAVQDYILKCFDEGIYGGLVPHPVLEDDDEEEKTLKADKVKEEESLAESAAVPQPEAETKLDTETNTEAAEETAAETAAVDPADEPAAVITQVQGETEVQGASPL